MAFSTDQFRQHFAKHSDFSRTSRFEVRLIAPNVLGTDLRDLRFQCESSELPGYNINTVDGRYYGVPQPVASFAAFNDITLNFICAGDLWERKFFDRWVNYIVPINSYNLEYKDTYISPKIDILQFPEGEQDNSNPENVKPIYTVSLFNAFPTSIGAMQLNWSDDGIHRLAVTFKYDFWITGELEAENKNIPDPQNKSAKASGSTPPLAGRQSTSSGTQRPPIGRKI